MAGADLVVPVKCPACGRKISLNARTSAPGKVIRCPCGAEIKLTGDDLRQLQRSMDDVLRSLKKLGR